jgi:outer membrane protein OmpA-like peptidoglycan-associated protein/opacity protein-like surface antigen
LALTLAPVLAHGGSPAQATTPDPLQTEVKSTQTKETSQTEVEEEIWHDPEVPLLPPGESEALENTPAAAKDAPASSQTPKEAAPGSATQGTSQTEVVPQTEVVASKAPAKLSAKTKVNLDNAILFGTQLGWHFFDNQRFGGNLMRDRASLGLRIGYAFNETWQIEIPFAYVPSRAGAADVDLYNYGAMAVGNLWGHQQWNPYAMLGLAGYSLNAPALSLDRNDLALTYGGGMKWFITRHIALRAEARALSLITDGGTDFEVSGGFVAYVPLKKAPRAKRAMDSDQDGIADAEDDCPQSAEDKDGVSDQDGCPDQDNDQDGITDDYDKCQAEAEDRDGFADEDGCPETDNDQDGVLDALDKCPLKAEDKDGFADEDGCEETDNDQDGIADDSDRCPNEPETMNGILDEDGCADSELKKFSGVVNGIRFAVNSNIIDRSSYPLLDEAADLFHRYASVAVLIEGHTDSTGSAKFNQMLSRDRAEAVRQYLIAKGIAPDRLTIIGVGEDQPIADNGTATGRAQNRRIQFRLTDKVTGEIKELPSDESKK